MKCMKKVISLLVLVSLLFSLTACANQLPSSVPGESPDAPEVTAAADAVMKPGVYEAEGQGFGLAYKLKVQVEVDETCTFSISVDRDDNVETDSIRDDTVKVLIPRMIESQSFTVDALTGATATSVGIREAVRSALEQAIAAAGTDPSAISAFMKKTVKSDEEKTLDTDILIVGLGG